MKPFQTWEDQRNADRKRIADLERALLYVRSLAKTEQERPTELHMTCLSIIQKTAEGVLDLQKYETQ